MKKNIILIIMIFVISICSLNISNASTSKNIINDTKVENISAQEEIDTLVYDISTKGINKSTLSECIEMYKELSNIYSNDEISDMIEESVEGYGEENINSENLNSVKNILHNFKSEDLVKILNTIDIDSAIEKLSSGSTILDLVKVTSENMTTEQKAELITSVIFSSRITKRIISFLVIIILYKLLIRCIIYKKAGKHIISAFIPIYRDITMLKICNINPWVLLLIFIPVIGWFILWLFHVASRFMLAEKFGKSELFGLGLWLLWPIFDAILVFSGKTEYEKGEEN